MADLILIPVVVLLLYKIQYNKNGFNSDYLSVDTTQTMRGIFMLDVVLFHFCLEYLDVEQKALSVCYGDDAVKIFFFLSGYGLVCSYKKKGDAYLKGFFSHRIAKIAIPFIVAVIPYVIMFSNTNYYLPDTSLTLKNMFLLFFKYGYTVVYNAWYVVELIILYVLFYISFKISKGNFEKGVNIAVVGTMICMCAFYIIYLNTEWLHIWYYSTYAFAMGIIWSAKEEKIIDFIHKHFNPILWVTCITVVLIVIFRREIIHQFSNDNYIMSRNIILGPFIIFGVIIGSMKIKVNCPIWKFFGKISYEAYLIHGIFYSSLRKYIENDLLFITVGVIASILAATILWYIDRFVLKYYFRLIDGKKRR